MVSKKYSNDKLNQARENLLDGAGRISASLLGILNRVCGQIYALLLVSPEPSTTAIGDNVAPISTRTLSVACAGV